MTMHHQLVRVAGVIRVPTIQSQTGEAFLPVLPRTVRLLELQDLELKFISDAEYRQEGEADANLGNDGEPTPAEQIKSAVLRAAAESTAAKHGLHVKEIAGVPPGVMIATPGSPDTVAAYRNAGGPVATITVVDFIEAMTPESWQKLLDRLTDRAGQKEHPR